MVAELHSNNKLWTNLVQVELKQINNHWKMNLVQINIFVKGFTVNTLAMLLGFSHRPVTIETDVRARILKLRGQ